MQVQNVKLNDPAFGSCKILNESFKYLPSSSKFSTQITIFKAAERMREVSKGVRVAVEVKPYDVDNVLISLNKNSLLGKMHQMFINIPTKDIGKAFSSFDFGDLLELSVKAFKNAIKTDKNISSEDLSRKVFNAVNAKNSNYHLYF